VAEFWWYSRSGPRFSNTFTNPMNFPLFKDLDDQSWRRNGNSWLAERAHSSSKPHVMFIYSFQPVHYAWWHRVCVQHLAASQPVVVFQRITVYMGLWFWVYVVHLTNDLNPRSPVYFITHGSKQGQQSRFFAV